MDDQLIRAKVHELMRQTKQDREFHRERSRERAYGGHAKSTGRGIEALACNIRLKALRDVLAALLEEGK